MNARLILDNMPDVNTLEFDIVKNCFVGALLESQDGDNWLWSILYQDEEGRKESLSEIVRDNISKYELSDEDMLDLSEAFEVEDDPINNTVQDGYDAVRALLISKL